MFDESLSEGSSVGPIGPIWARSFFYSSVILLVILLVILPVILLVILPVIPLVILPVILPVILLVILLVILDRPPMSVGNICC